MTVDLGLLLQNVRVAFANGQTQQGLFFLNYAITLAEAMAVPVRSPLDVAIGLDPGLVRQVNEDCVFALQGLLPQTHEVFGLFVLCDGMGGHACGLDAAHLAIETMVETILPPLLGQTTPVQEWIHLLTAGVQAANRAIYLRNLSLQTPQGRETGAQGTLPTQLMGTTVTAALVLPQCAYVVNVGDSRAYLYRPDLGLTRITRDHSVVAALLADRVITEEEVYTHPLRHQIVRALGTHASVEVDTFVVSLQTEAVLLLCSDGLWEMTRDPKIEAVVGCAWASAPTMVHRLVTLAKEGGAKDNIGLVVVQVGGRAQSHETSGMSTLVPPVDALARLVPLSSQASAFPSP